MPCQLLTICGSLQSASANRAALDVAVSYLRSLGDVGLEQADELAAIPAFNPDLDDSAETAVARFRDRIARCDVVMIATPEYAGAIPGALKNALDWVVGSGELYGKPVVVLSAGTTGGVHARQQLAQTLAWQGAAVVGDLGIAAPRTKTDEAGRFTDEATIEAIERLAQSAVEVATAIERTP